MSDSELKQQTQNTADSKQQQQQQQQRTEEELKKYTMDQLASLVHNYGPQCISVPFLTISRITEEDIANLKTRDSEQEQQQIVEAIIETAAMEAMWTQTCAPSDGFSRRITEPPGDST